VVDVVNGETRGHQTVLIANGRIAAAGSSDAVSIPAQAIRIPGEGRYLIPGLWDMHIHLRSNQVNPDVPLVEVAWCWRHGTGIAGYQLEAPAPSGVTLIG
jgi:predicted amidohydrolase YtcJ